MKERGLILFFILSMINICSELFQWQIGIFISKPLLMLTLAIWFYLNTKKYFSPFAKYILIGVLFSMAGDIFLMFVYKNVNLFLVGLGSFLITHLFYIAAFINYGKTKKGLLLKNKWAIMPILIYFLTFNYYCISDIPVDLKFPVIIYSLVITTMLVSAINVSCKIEKRVGKQLIMGAVLFVISDSFIAIEKFKETFITENYFGVMIMSTYLLGQYLIVNGTKHMINSNSSSIMSSPK